MAARSLRSLHLCLRDVIDEMQGALPPRDCRLTCILAAYSRLLKFYLVLRAKRVTEVPTASRRRFMDSSD